MAVSGPKETGVELVFGGDDDGDDDDDEGDNGVEEADKEEDVEAARRTMSRAVRGRPPFSLVACLSRAEPDA